ncbi:MAG: WG repeat-containing protein [Muribaculaceae bacterium]|nr:WG repeat-containing protein [Muribaculaceae bacterium]
MKRNISFKIWLSIFFGGIWQFICNIFSWENKAPFWRVVWAIITLCCVAFTSMLAYAFYKEFIYDNSNLYSYDSSLSSNFKFKDTGYNSGSSFIYDVRTKKKVIKDIDWIAFPEDPDSLIVVAKKGKRGFVNMFTAEISIPFIYDAAWSFTDGVAAVSLGDSIFFIDHSGTPINDKKFKRDPKYGSYVYHGNFAAIPLEGRFGLIDRNGDWTIAPTYDNIHIGPNNMWYVLSNDKWGVLNDKAQFVFPVEFQNVTIHSNNGITLTNNDNSQSRYDYDGSLIDKFVFDEVFELAYFINEFDDDGNQKKAIDINMLAYSVGNYYGLMTRKGIPVTPPLYNTIESVAPGVYLCEIPDACQSILINEKGEKINS